MGWNNRVATEQNTAATPVKSLEPSCRTPLVWNRARVAASIMVLLSSQ
jgi:hypothetical protein